MSMSHRAELQKIRSFPQLIRFLRDEMGWPIESEEYDDLVFDYEAEELGLDAASAAKIKEIKRLRPLAANQPWGIFFVSFEPKRLPVVALRRILSAFVMRKRESANAAERMAWETDDLLFISNYGEGEERQLSFAHFSQDEHGGLPTLRVLGWDNLDTPLHLDHVADQLTEKLAWPRSESDVERWRETWGSAFTLRHGEVIATSKALAVRLAELARAIRERVKSVLAIETDSGPVTHLMKAFKEALVHDLEADEFADMYAQTVAYGLLSARIANPKAKTAEGFAGQLPIASPFLRELMETFLHVGDRSGGGAVASPIDFDELGVSEVVELLDSPKTNMEAVVRDFGDKNPQEDPVIHFYEDFLKEYDKRQKVKRGVFYTPRPVVSYIVRSVDELLRSEFGLVDGLADITTWGEMIERHEGLAIPDGVESTAPFVTILDLATGTGTFLVETIDVVHRTLVEKWKREGHGEKEILDLWNDYVPKHLLPRLYGYELLMAPYAIAHLKIGLKLHETGYRFCPDDRLRVYLTNSLEPASDIGQQALSGMLPALAHEAHAVNDVKRTQRFTVVIGNPPYAKLSQNQGAWIDSLMERYKTTIKDQEIQRQALSNDYVKFLCLATHTLEQAGLFAIGMITDNSYLDGPLFRDMRSDLMDSYRTIHITDLGGNSRRVAASAADQNVFDIQQGVAVFLGITPAGEDRSQHFAQVRGTRLEKAAWLLVNTCATADSQLLNPFPPQRYFIPTITEHASEWEAWPPLPEIFAGGVRGGRPLPFNGAALATRHDSLAIAFSEAELREHLRAFFDETESWESLNERFRLCHSSHFDFNRARTQVTLTEAESSIRPILYRPFDTRFVVYHPLILGEPRQDVMRHLLAGSLALLSTRRVTGRPYDNVFVCRGLVEYKAATHDRNTQVFPLYLDMGNGLNGATLFSAAESDGKRTNLSPSIYDSWKSQLGFSHPEQIFCTIYAILFSPEYRYRFREWLQQDYARVPQPASPELGRHLAQIGAQLVALHLLESAKLDDFITAYSGPGNPEVEQVHWANDTVWLGVAPTKRGQTPTPGMVGFRGVPEAVWNFDIGGYQVCEKWLKDRRGRTLSDDDITHYHKVVVAIAETMRLMQEIDEVIEEHGGWPGAFAAGAV